MKNHWIGVIHDDKVNQRRRHFYEMKLELRQYRDALMASHYAKQAKRAGRKTIARRLLDKFFG